MQTQTPVHPVGFLLKAFVAWYTLDFSKRIVLTGRDGLRVVAAVVPFFFLARTFFSPWKQIRDETPRKGFNIERLAEALTLNATARAIGMLFRTAALIIGAVLAVVVMLLTVACLMAWVILPVFFSGVLLLAVIVL